MHGDPLLLSRLLEFGETKVFALTANKKIAGKQK